MYFDYSLIGTFFLLVSLEVILGVDNIIFIALTVEKLRKKDQFKARTIGLIGAFFFRILALLFVDKIMSLSGEAFKILDFPVSYKDIVMFSGGIFLLYQSTASICEEIYRNKKDFKGIKGENFIKAIFNILFLDIVFSIDSIVVAIGLTDDVMLIITAMFISMIFMLIFSGWIAKFMSKNPYLKTPALLFIFVIGIYMILQGLGIKAQKEYLYFSFVFSILVEILNKMIRKNISSKVVTRR